MAICVEIDIDDAGNVQVGICPPDEEEGEKEYMQPVESIDVALAKAKAFLNGKQPSGPKTLQEAMFPEKEDDMEEAGAAQKA